MTKVVVNIANDAGFFPGLALCGFGAGFVRLPSAFGEDPARSSSRLDKEHVGFCRIERYDTCNESFSAVAVA